MMKPYFMGPGLKPGSFYVYRYRSGFCNSKLIRMGLTEFEAETLVHELNLLEKRKLDRYNDIQDSIAAE